jgi:hypothetical protein
VADCSLFQGVLLCVTNTAKAQQKSCRAINNKESRLSRGRNRICSLRSSVMFTIVVEYSLYETIITYVCKFASAVRKETLGLVPLDT